MRMGLESQAAKSTSGFQGAIIIMIVKMIFKVVMMVIMIRAIIGQVWSGKADSVQGPKLSNHGRYNIYV